MTHLLFLLTASFFFELAPVKEVFDFQAGQRDGAKITACEKRARDTGEIEIVLTGGKVQKCDSDDDSWNGGLLPGGGGGFLAASQDSQSQDDDSRAKASGQAKQTRSKLLKNKNKKALGNTPKGRAKMKPKAKIAKQSPPTQARAKQSSPVANQPAVVFRSTQIRTQVQLEQICAEALALYETVCNPATFATVQPGKLTAMISKLDAKISREDTHSICIANHTLEDKEGGEAVCLQTRV